VREAEYMCLIPWTSHHGSKQEVYYLLHFLRQERIIHETHAVCMSEGESHKSYAIYLSGGDCHELPYIYLRGRDCQVFESRRES
jgi:hypothetical protein